MNNKSTKKKKNSRTSGTTYWIAGLFVLLGLMSWFFYAVSQPASPKGPTPLNEASKEMLRLQSDDHVRGSSSGSVILVEYLDFECEACAAYSPLVKQLKDEFKDDIVIVTRFFPLAGHRNSMTAATSVEAAGRQGKFWEMQDKLFAEQKKWGEKADPDMSIFIAYAAEIGLDMERFSKDIKDPTITERIKRDIASGKTLNVNATPSFFLNGTQISGIRSYQDFSDRVRTELSKTTSL